MSDLLFGERLKDGAGLPSQLASRAGGAGLQDVQVRQLAESRKRGRACDTEAPLDDTGGEDGLLEGQVDQPVRCAS